MPTTAINPSKFIALAKPLYKTGSTNDARTQYIDVSLTPAITRDYQNCQEILDYLFNSNQAVQISIRTPAIPLYVNEGGTLNSDGTFTGGTRIPYWFRDDAITLRRINKYVGIFTNLSALTNYFNGNNAATNPQTTPETGLYAYVGSTLYSYNGSTWAPVGGGSSTIATLTPATSAIAVGDNYDVAFGKAQGQINASNALISNIDPSVIGLPYLGVIINDNFTRSALGSNWTNNGAATFSIVANQLAVANSASSYSSNNNLAYTGYGNSNLEGFVATMNFIAGSINATSFGIGIGMEGNSPFIKNSQRAILRMDTANLGKIQFDGYNDVTLHQSTISTGGMAIAAGDIINLYFNFIKNKIILTATNVTQNASNTFEIDIQTTANEDSYIPNSYLYTIISAGGAQTVTSYIVDVTDQVHIPFLYIGDSITKGNNTSNLQNRRAEIVMSVANTLTQTNAGSGNLIEDINVAEILSLSPTKIILMIGINNFQVYPFQSMATVQGKYATLVAALVAGGYVVGTSLFIGTLIPGPNYNLTIAAQGVTFNAWLKSNYMGVIDYWTALYSGDPSVPLPPQYNGGDGIHPGDIGQLRMAAVDINYFKLKPQPRKKGNVFPVYYNPNFNIQIGDQQGRSYRPRYPLTISTPLQNFLNAVPQLNLNQDGGDNGLFIGSLGQTSGQFAAGMKFTIVGGAPLVTYLMSAGSGVTMGNGVLYFFAYNNAVPGSIANSNNPGDGPVMTITPYNRSTGGGGLIGMGMVPNPGAFIDIGGGYYQNQVANLRLRNNSSGYGPAAFYGGEIYNLLNKMFINMGTDASTITRLDSQSSVIKNTAADYTAMLGDATILVDASGGNRIITINPALSNLVQIKKIDSSANTVTIVPATGTIEGAASVVLSAQWAFKRLQGDGAATVLIFS